MHYPETPSTSGAEEAAKIWGGGAKYVTRIYLYGEKSCSYGMIVKVEGASAPPAPLAQPPLYLLEL